MKTLSMALLLAVAAGVAIAAEGPGTAEKAPAAPAAAAQPAAEPAKPAASGSVARAQFTSAVQDREPTDNLTTMSNDKNRVYYFTELKGLSGQKVTHRWEFNGQTMAEVSFDVGGDRWRVFSSKTLDPIWLGEWKASVLDANGATLSVNTFSYTAAPKTAAPAGAASASAPTN